MCLRLQLLCVPGVHDDGDAEDLEEEEAQQAHYIVHCLLHYTVHHLMHYIVNRVVHYPVHHTVVHYTVHYKIHYILHHTVHYIVHYHNLPGHRGARGDVPRRPRRPVAPPRLRSEAVREPI